MWIKFILFVNKKQSNILNFTVLGFSFLASMLPIEKQNVLTPYRIGFIVLGNSLVEMIRSWVLSPKPVQQKLEVVSSALEAVIGRCPVLTVQPAYFIWQVLCAWYLRSDSRGCLLASVLMGTHRHIHRNERVHKKEYVEIF